MKNIGGVVIYIMKNLTVFGEQDTVEGISIVNNKATYHLERIISAPEYWYKYHPTERDCRKVMVAVFRKWK
jgi:hypothetical protein